MLAGGSGNGVREEQAMTKVYDGVTGSTDLTEGAPAWPAGKRWEWHEQVLYGFPQGWSALVRLPLSTTQLRVLLALVPHCQWGNRCQVSCAQLGRELGLSGSWVSRVLHTLVPHQLLLLDRTPGQQQPTIVLSPLLCWKGRPWHLAYARRQFLAAWALRYADGLPRACAAGHSVPSPGMRVTGMGEPPGGGSADPGAHPFTHYPPRYPVGSVC
jgi:hypothetical protein